MRPSDVNSGAPPQAAPPRWSVGRALGVAWTPVSLVIVLLALGSAVETLAPELVDWRGPFATVVELYQRGMEALFGRAGELIAERSGVQFPDQTGDLIVAYAAGASAFAFGGGASLPTAKFADIAKGVTGGAVWPVSLLMFVGRAILERRITRFAVTHSGWFFGYLVAGAGLFAAALGLNAGLPT